MSVFQVRTINASGMGDPWESGDVWESEPFTTAREAVREYIDRLSENMIPVLPEVHEPRDAFRYTILMRSEIDRMERWGNFLCDFVPAGETVAEINDGFYRVELRCIEN